MTSLEAAVFKNGDYGFEKASNAIVGGYVRYQSFWAAGYKALSWPVVFFGLQRMVMQSRVGGFLKKSFIHLNGSFRDTIEEPRSFAVKKIATSILGLGTMGLGMYTAYTRLNKLDPLVKT